MKRWRVIVELPAQQDIVEAHQWLEERDPEAANRWFNSLYDTIGSLELFPERYPLAPESCFFNREIREVFHGRRQHKYRILFTVKETEVHLLHVRHGARLALGEGAPDEEV
jgi:plasmid stabilization system protein ParE